MVIPQGPAVITRFYISFILACRPGQAFGCVDVGHTPRRHCQIDVGKKLCGCIESECNNLFQDCYVDKKVDCFYNSFYDKEYYYFHHPD